MDNPFVIPTAGQGDWDSSLTADLNAIERGYHVTERAGIAVTSGQVLWLNSGGYAFPFDPNSSTIFPHGLAYTAAASGDSLTMLAWGIVRSLAINSVSIPGRPLYVSALTPGLIVSTPTGARIGRGLTGYGVLFQPQFGPHRLSQLVDVNTTNVASGKVLTWTDATSAWVPAAPSAGGSTALAGLTDVNTNGVSDGKVLQWADASSKWVPAVPVTGATKLATLTDVDTTGVASGMVLGWSNASSKWTPRADNSGGGAFAVGSPPAIIQFAYKVTGANSVSFGVAPTSGNLLFAICFNPTGDTAGTGWTKKDENSTGLDFGFACTKIAGGSESTTQTPVSSTFAAGVVAVWEIQGPAVYVAAFTQSEQSAIGNVPLLAPNAKDCVGFAAVCAVNTITRVANEGTRDALDNTGGRKLHASHSDLSTLPVCGTIALFNTAGSNKCLSAIVANSL